jgi:hypothetical protein
MRKVIIAIFAMTFIVLGCQTKYRYPRFDYSKNIGGNPCVLAFKDRVFFAILEECYKGTDAMKEIHKRDVGNPYDGIYSASLFKSIDSIGKDFARRIPPPILCDECTKEQNYFMAQALHFYASYELDSIAKAKLQEHGMYKCK